MERFKILKHICLDKSFIFFLLIIILTGNFNHFICFFLLLLIHEFGHALTGIILGYKLDKITFYPYGGITKFNLPLNVLIRDELLILINGPLFQIIGFFLLRNFFPDMTLYHYTLLIFNLLPIYPLDGGKILNSLFGIFNPYLKSFYITFFISIIFIIFLIIYNIKYFNLNLIVMIVILLIKLFKVYQKRYFYYNRFLLERYLKEFNFEKRAYIKNIHSFYRERKHFINSQNEKDFLKDYFGSTKY